MRCRQCLAVLQRAATRATCMMIHDGAVKSKMKLSLLPSAVVSPSLEFGFPSHSARYWRMQQAAVDSVRSSLMSWRRHHQRKSEAAQ